MDSKTIFFRDQVISISLILSNNFPIPFTDTKIHFLLSNDFREEFRTTFLESTLSIDELRKRTISISGIGISDVEDGGVILRSVYWRVSHSPLLPTHQYQLPPN